MTRMILAAPALIMALTACQPVPPPVAPPELVDACGAAGYQGLIGQPRSTLTAMRFPIGTRVIGPEDAVTADYSAERLNIEYGTAGLIEKVSCF